MQSKNQEIADLKVKLNSLRAEKCQLEQNERALNAAGQFEMIANCYAERESEELKIRLRDANNELQMLRRRFYG